MKQTLVLTALAGALALGACSDADPTLPFEPEAPSPAKGGQTGAWVTTSADAGGGSFRDAVEAANADPRITRIRFDRSVGVVDLTAPIVYTGSQDLTIDGRGAVLDGSAVEDAFVATGGASLSFRSVTVRNAGGDGIFVAVPASAHGTLGVSLRDVTLLANGEFGLHVDDQTERSPASVRFSMVGTHVVDNGFDPDIDDKDGIRIDEGGPGDIRALIRRSVVTGNAGDGVEFDEIDDGDVRVIIRHTSFDENGSQPQLPSDLEDGFDIDEAGSGDIRATFLHVTANANFDEGIDLDEAGPGGIVAFMNQVESNGNTDENIKLSEDVDVDDGFTLPEDGSGGIEFLFRNVTARGSTDDGAQIEEFGNGDLNGVVVRSTFSDNGDDGLEVEQGDAGGGLVRLQRVTTENNADDGLNLDGVEVVEVP